MSAEHGGLKLNDHVQLSSPEDAPYTPTGIIKEFRKYEDSGSEYARVADDHPWLGDAWLPLEALVRI